MPASRRHTGTVAEVLNESAIVSLNPGCGRCVAVGQRAVDNIEPALSLVQPQLKVSGATPREVLCPPLYVEDAVGSSATYRCEYARWAIDQIEVVPVWEDGVVVGSPRQASVTESRISGHELGITVG